MEVVIFIGIPASGKSTFYKERFFNTHIRINLDMLKTRHRESLLSKACLDAKQPFVVDNTNVLKRDRAQIIRQAREADFRVVGYYFQAKLQDALERNSRRNGKECIPEGGLVAKYTKLQIPEVGEGFDELFYVMINPDTGEFVVKEWNNEI
jgi:predicted kinase